MLAHSIFFYFFSFIAVSAATMVTISRNTVYSVFFLILVFVSVSILFIMIGAEFLGVIMLIVYVGAVAVLFLFVVMMLNINEQSIKKPSRKGFTNNISVGSIVGLIIFLELLVVIGGWKYKDSFVPLSSIKIDFQSSNTQDIGKVLYTDYIHLFLLSGMILLVAMIGAIVLTFRKRDGIKQQSYFKQISRERNESVELADPKNNEGVKIDV